MQWTGVQVGPLVPLEAVLLGWVDTNWEILKSWAPDVPWRYNERASLSILAGTVWRKGGFALEEFTTEKHAKKSRSSKMTTTAGSYSRGRCDLYFELDALECEMEAKFYRPLIDKTANPQKVLTKHLEVAVQDATRNRSYDNRLRIGLLIVTPFISLSTLGTKKDILLNWHACLGQWIDAAKKVPGAAAAWFFPKDLKLALFENSPYCKHFFPGVVMLLKEVRRQSS